MPKNCIRFRSCSSSLVVDFPVVVQRPIPHGPCDHETPQLRVDTVAPKVIDKVFDVPVRRSSSFLWRKL